MAKQITATAAKNNFGGLLDDVASLGRVEVVKHGRVVAVVLSPRELEAQLGKSRIPQGNSAWGETHMIPPERARAAQMLTRASDFDED